LSTVAYQGAAGLDPARILRESEAEFPLPDLALLLELDVETALGRVRARGARVESAFETRERLERVAKIFREIDRPYLARIDANRDADAVALAIAAEVRARLDLP
jgi:dTMP kinase